MHTTPTPVPNLAQLTSVHGVAAPPDALFPLLCPVREYEWIPGWRCRVVHAASGLVEPGCVFVTEAPGEEPTTWLTTVHDPRARRVGFVRVTPGRRVVRLGLEVEAAAADRSRLRIGFRVSGLGDGAAGEVQAAAPGGTYSATAAHIAEQAERYLVGGRAVGSVPADLGQHPDARAVWAEEAPLAAAADAAFPLLCPVRERAWLPGWACELVHTASGLVEPDCAWVTDPRRWPEPVPTDRETVCAVAAHDPAAGLLSFARFTPERLVALWSLRVAPEGAGRSRLALEVTLTALDEAGRELVRRVRRDGGPYAGLAARLAGALEAGVAAGAGGGRPG